MPSLGPNIQWGLGWVRGELNASVAFVPEGFSEPPTFRRLREEHPFAIIMIIPPPAPFLSWTRTIADTVQRSGLELRYYVDI